MPFITSKIGKLESINVYTFKFTKELISQKEQLNKFVNWLKRQTDLYLFSINETGFSTLNKLEPFANWQYLLINESSLFPPFQNTQLISSYLSSIFRNVFIEKYIQFHNLNEFIIEELDVDVFKISKNVQFNIEFFSDGYFYLHFNTLSRILSNDSIDLNYIIRLRNKINQKNSTDLNINLIELKRFRREKISLFGINLNEEISAYLEKNKKAIASFDYEFLSKYLGRDFRHIVEELTRHTDISIRFLEQVIRNINFPKTLNLQEKPFYRIINLNKAGRINNLIVGNNKFVYEQSAAYYNGVYKTLDNCLLVPIYVDDYNESSDFIDIFSKFNQNSVNFEIGNNIRISTSDDNCFDKLVEFIKEEKHRRIVFPIFLKYTFSKELMSKLRKIKAQFQFCVGENKNRSELSNFSVKCIENNGGLLSIIKDLKEMEGTYFVGIDLGHSHSQEKHFTNLSMSFFDEKGKHIYNGTIKNIRLNEILDIHPLCTILVDFFTFLKKNKKIFPNRFIIHRDGKTNAQEIEIINNSFYQVFNIKDIDIVEIIKQGQPILGDFDGKEFINLESGDCFLDEEHGYALLITNTQANEKREVVSSITIKVKQGQKPLSVSVSQIYWFTKIYTNNLYNSTRLPATTQKANNLAGTSSKIHISTFKG